MNPKAMGLLILNTIQRELRNKTVLFLSILTLMALLAIFYFLTGVVSGFLGGGDDFSAAELSFFQANESTLRIFLSLLGSWASIMALLVGSSLVRADQDENVLGLLLSLPIHRWEYLLARLIGGTLLVLGIYLFGSILLLTAFSIKAGAPLGLTLWPQTLLPVTMSILSLGVVALLFQLFFPKMICFFFSLFMMVIISRVNLAVGDQGISRFVEELGVLKFMALIIHGFFPPVGNWGRLNGSVLNQVASVQDFISPFFHTMVSASLVFIAASFIFKYRDL
jgi:ABC-type transport system involved in multi-copper enzyme maturation permease subunit